jgi:hypothetical protein
MNSIAAISRSFERTAESNHDSGNVYLRDPPPRYVRGLGYGRKKMAAGF